MRRVFAEDVTEGGSEESRVGGGQDERRAKLDDVVMRAIGAGKDAALAKAVDDVGGLGGGGNMHRALIDEIEAQEKTGAADVAEQGVDGLQILELRDPARADLERILLKTFVSENVQNSEARSAGDRITAKSTEEFHAVAERGGDFGSRDDGGNREGIANGLAENDDIRYYALSFEAPEVRAETAEADLNFVGDADAPSCAD